MVPYDESYNLVGNTWIFRLKHSFDGSIEGHKAQIVAKSFHHTPRIDFVGTLSKVIKSCMIRVIITVAISYNWCIRPMDINNAF